MELRGTHPHSPLADGTTITTTTAMPPRKEAVRISGTAVGASASASKLHRVRAGAEPGKGVQISKEIRAEIAVHVAEMKEEHSVTPGLAVVLVGARPVRAAAAKYFRVPIILPTGTAIHTQNTHTLFSHSLLSYSCTWTVAPRSR